MRQHAQKNFKILLTNLAWEHAERRKPQVGSSLKRGFTIGTGRSKADLDDTTKPITGPEPFAYHPKRQDRQILMIAC